MQTPFNFAALSGTPPSTDADKVLDAAVDELFENVDHIVGLEDETGDVARMWDTTEFGEETSREEDLQLGSASLQDFVCVVTCSR